MPNVVLILGGGANIGAAVSQGFSAKGYKVASTSRTDNASNAGKNGIDLHITGDLSNSESVAHIFGQVVSKLGHPRVVIYNASAYTPHSREDPLSVPLESFTKDLQTNTVSLLAAAQHALQSFEQLGSGVFIYTGNLLNRGPISGPFLTLGVGKSASAYLIATASEAYKAKGFKFYYADERTSEGDPMLQGVTASGHSQFYMELAEGGQDVPWWATFVSGHGYVKFDN